jgi:hypothetical protein
MTLQFSLLRALVLPWCLEVSSEAWRIGVVAGILLFFMPLCMGPHVSPNVRILYLLTNHSYAVAMIAKLLSTTP